jgi:hypothetical protein
VVTPELIELLAERIEAKPMIQAVPAAGVSDEELQQGNAVLNQWMAEHYDSDIGERAKARYRFVLERVKNNWRDKSFWFKILPPGARSERWTQYKKPSDALEAIESNPAWGYRGMSWEEWQAIKKTGKIQSKGEHNFSNQTDLTFFAPQADAAQHYSAGFAPWWYSPTKRKPGVVVAVPRELLIDHTQDAGVPNGELACKGPMPASEIKAVWFVVPEEMARGDIQLILDNLTKKVSEGSRMSPSGRYVVMPASKIVEKEINEEAPSVRSEKHTAAASKPSSDRYLIDEVMPTISDDQFAAVIGLHGFVLVNDLVLDPRTQTLEGILQHQELELTVSLTVRGSYVRADDGEWLVQVSEMGDSDPDEASKEHRPFSFDPETDAVQLMKAAARLLGKWLGPRVGDGPDVAREGKPRPT